MDVTPSDRDDDAISAVRAVVERHLSGTGCTVVDVEQIGVDDWSGRITRRFRIGVHALLPDLERGRETIEMTWINERSWTDASALDEFVRSQRMRADRVTARGGALVDPVLAAHLAAQRNHQPCRRLVFSIIQGVRSRHTLVSGVSNARLKDGRLIARVELGPGMAWRDGELTLKDRSLPETMVSALSGRPVDDLVAHDMLRGMTIRRVRNTRDGLVAIVEAEGVPYDVVWNRLGG
jgi:hypothetical protein